MRTAFQSGRNIAAETHPDTRVKWSVLVWMVGIVLLLALAPLRSAEAQNPFALEFSPNDGGVEPETVDGVQDFPDPFGSVQELGPVNGSSTKLGVVHTALPAMLNFTNPNGQTDIVTIWLAKRQAANDDTWLYFAWERVATSGSSVIAYEFQQNSVSQDCDYDPALDLQLSEDEGETDLINLCNPWGGRQDGDFQIVWDFKGGATDIVLREFNNSEFDSNLLPSDPAVYVAELSDDTSRGEGAINLSATVFLSQTGCTSIGNIIPGTITGNSDSADYKDTVLADFTANLTISNCATVRISKKTVPPDLGQPAETFTFNNDLVFVESAPDDSFNLSDTDSVSYTDVDAPHSSYYVNEADPGLEFDLTLVDCSNTADTVDFTTTSVGVDFALDRGEKLDCEFTNTKRGTITLVKNTMGGDDTFTFTHDIPGIASSLTTSSGTKTDPSDLLQPATYTLSEDSKEGWDLTSSSCTGGKTLPSIDLGPGENITCTFNNQARSNIRIQKQTQGNYDGRFFFTAGSPLSNFDLTTVSGVSIYKQFLDLPAGSYSVNETVPPDWTLVSRTCNDGSNTGSIGLAGGESVICTFINKPKTGAIKISKRRKFASPPCDDLDLECNANDRPHPGVKFEISGGSLGTETIEVITDPAGEFCYDASGAGLVFSAIAGDYMVREIVPNGYVADGSETKTVSVDKVASCSSGTPNEVTFRNTPLTNVTVTATSVDPGATKSKIECFEGSQDETGAITMGQLINDDPAPVFEDNVPQIIANQLPEWDESSSTWPKDLIVCTIKIDP